MLPAFSEIRRSDVYDGTADCFGRGDDDIIVFRNLERVQLFAGLGFVENAEVNRIWDGVVDEFAENETVFAVVEELHGVGGDGEARADVGVVLQYL